MKSFFFAPVLALVTLPATLFAASIPLGESPATGNGLDQPVAFAVDALGGIAVTGIGHAPGQAQNFVTVKSAAGRVLWTRSYNGPVNSYDEPKALVTDSAGNTYVTGSSRGAKGNDFATVKYGADGQELWTARYDSSKSDDATALAVGPDGSVYVVGSSDGEGGVPAGQVLVKYSTTGAQLSVTHLGEEPGHAFDLSPPALAVDEAGNVLIAGATAGLQEHFDTLVIKLNAAGHEVAHARFGGSGLSQDFPAAVAFTPDGSFVVAGTGGAKGVAETDVFVAKFDPNGLPLWSSRYGSLGEGADKAVTLSVTAQGNVLVLGSTHHDGANGLAVLKLDPQGTRLGLTEEMLGSAVAISAKSSFSNGEIITATLRPGVGANGPTVATFRTPNTTSVQLPQITLTPQGYELFPGVNRLLSVQANNASGFQWFRDGVMVRGATTATLSPGGQSGDYAVEVSNSFGTVLSPLAQVRAVDVIYNFGLRTHGSFRALFGGESGRIYELQSSSDLTLWSTFATQRFTGPPVEITDTSITGVPHRYYRALRFL